jgi:hypothetical protein
MSAGPASPPAAPAPAAAWRCRTPRRHARELQRDPRPRRARRPLDAEQPADDAMNAGARGHHERGGARRAARDPLDEAHLVEPVPEHAEHGEAARRRRATGARSRRAEGDGAEQRAGEQHAQPVEGRAARSSACRA